MTHYLNFLKTALLLFAVCCYSFIAYAQPYTDYLGAGHMNGITISSSNGGTSANNVANAVGLNPTEEDASRFLAQASFGANYETIQDVVNIGIEAWVDQQLLMPPTYLTPIAQSFYDGQVANGTINPAIEDYFGSDQATAAYMQIIMTSPDQLRHRVAYALSQLWVVSGMEEELSGNGFAISDYYDLLVANAFGNYRDIMSEMTLSVQMGHYLSHLNNPKADPDENIHPDENYAREIMQLFTIGLHELNMNGTYQLDASGDLIPTYDNNDIKEFAQVFTGLGGSVPSVYNPEGEVEFYSDIYDIDMTAPMIMYEEFHDESSKILLNGTVLPAGQTGMQDINDALDHLFNHPNVAPFVSHKLIQRLVTSNPSPDYIERVANVFADNGMGVRGDMQAVVKAILMDQEARRCAQRSNPTNGLLVEPLLRRTRFLKAFDPYNDQNVFYDDSYWFWEDTRQMVFHAPTVFNFYKPGYMPPGPIGTAGLTAPEFEIMYSATAIGYINQAYAWTWWEYPIGAAIGEEEIETFLDFTDEEALIDNHEALMDRLDLLLCHGNMTAFTRNNIISALNAIDQPWNEEDKVTLAVYLTLMSPDYVILK